MSDEITNKFFEWIRRGSTGCGFAQTFSNPPTPDCWASSVVPGREDYGHIASVIQTFLESTVETAEAAQVILPDVTSAEEIIHLTNALCATKKWFCSEVQSTENKQTLLIGLRWLVPDELHLNWVLGFANLESMPATRRAPYTTLVVRPGAPGRVPSIAQDKPTEIKERRLDRGRIPVHLADMETRPKIRDENLKALWQVTQKKKIEKITNDHVGYAAKAKITFSLPRELKTSLNCISDTIALK
jgi:hypothetical protein